MVARMLGKRLFCWVAVALLGVSAASSTAWAQDAETPETAPEATNGEATEGEAAEGGADESAQAAEPQAAPQPPPQPERPQTLDPPPPPPLMVVVMPGRRVPADSATALAAAFASALDEPAGRRDVHPLGNPAILERLAACEEDACYGGVLAEAQAAGGVFVGMERRGRRYDLTITLRDPVSGAARGEPIEGRLERDADPAETVAGLLEQIVPQLPSPPPPDPTLLVTVNVDGAQVQIDGIDIGESPVAPVTVAAGFHEVAVMRAGYASTRRRIQVAPGDSARVDVTLTALSPDLVAQNGGGNTSGNGNDEVFETPITEEWWFWTLIGGGALLVIGLAIGIGFAASSGGSQMVDNPTGLPLPRIEGGI